MFFGNACLYQHGRQCQPHGHLDRVKDKDAHIHAYQGRIAQDLAQATAWDVSMLGWFLWDCPDHHGDAD